jgi:hypothetical protein
VPEKALTRLAAQAVTDPGGAGLRALAGRGRRARRAVSSPGGELAEALHAIGLTSRVLARPSPIRPAGPRRRTYKPPCVGQFGAGGYSRCQYKRGVTI